MNPSVIPSLNMPRWYGLMWALGFYLGHIILNRIYKREQAPADWMDKTFLYILIAGILGARLGHCLFYQPEIYLKNPIEILYIWEGGLASHGGAFGIILAVFILNRRVIKKSMVWILDRLVIPTALAGALIRLGNLFNHEIVGSITSSPIGFKFLRHDISEAQAMSITNTKDSNEAYDLIANSPQYIDVWNEIPARHPSQLYEAIVCLFIFGLLMYLYWKTTAPSAEGFLMGVFFITIFGSRFLIEYIKEDQVAFEQGMLLNMGQILSIPLILIGFYFFFKHIKSIKKSTHEK